MQAFAEVRALAQEIAFVALEAALLYSLSRLLFVWVLESVVMRGHGGGWAIKLLRLPGNMVHEVSHAAGYWLCGYRVRELVPCISDPQGRGLCRVGKPWSPVASPWLATVTSAVLPLLVGTLVLRGLASVLEIPFTGGERGPHDGPVMSLLRSIWATLWSLDYREWRTYVFLLLAFSIGAELAPSETDLRRSIAPLLGIALGLAITAVYLGCLHPDWLAWKLFAQYLSRGLYWVAAALGFGFLATALAATFTLGPAIAWRKARRRMNARGRRRQ